MAIVKITPPEPRVVCPVELREQTGKAAHFLANSFSWQESAEGGQFWNSVFHRLSQIAEDGELR